VEESTTPMTMDASHPFAALATLPINIAVLYEWIRYVFIITLGVCFHTSRIPQRRLINVFMIRRTRGTG
jgi:hypothetical protein